MGVAAGAPRPVPARDPRPQRHARAAAGLGDAGGDRGARQVLYYTVLYLYCTVLIAALVSWLRSLGCRVAAVEVAVGEQKQSQTKQRSNTTTNTTTTASNVSAASTQQQQQQQLLQQQKQQEHEKYLQQQQFIKQQQQEHHSQQQQVEAQTKKKSKVQKFSYTRETAATEEEEKQRKEEKAKKVAMNIAQEAQEAIASHALQSMVKSDHNSSIFLTKAAEVGEAVYESHVTTSSSHTQSFSQETRHQQQQQQQQLYTKQDNLSFPELERMQPPPALPPKTKIMHSPSR